MSPKGVSETLTQKLGRVFDEEEAERLVCLYYSIFFKYKKFLEDVENDYGGSLNSFLRLIDGWYLFGDEDSFRTVCNFPTQGTGGVILRKAIKLAQESGLRVIIPLHDALYIEFDSGNLGAIKTLAKCMKQAFIESFPGQEEDASLIRLDIDIWGPEYKEGFIEYDGLKIKTQNRYVDERSEKDYKVFEKYFLTKL